MLIEQATVIFYKKGKALVQCEAKQACGSCAAHSSCGTKSLSALAGEKKAPVFEITTNQALEVGDKIKLGLAEKTLIGSLSLLYGLPLLILLLLAVSFSYIFANELLVALVMFSGMGLTFYGIKQWLDRHPQQDFHPVFLGKVE